MWLLVGLGNPGSNYERNRHNIGFMAVDEILHRHKFSGWKSKFKGEISDGEIEGEKVLLLKPQTFMNLSGESVQAAAAFYKIRPDHIVVFHDELDLEAGKIRTKQGGGSGGHNGIKSIDEHLGVNYHRVRLGIGHPGMKEMVTGHVLGDFAKADDVWLQPVLAGVADHAGLVVQGKMELFMTKVAQSVSPPKKETERQEQGK